LSKLNGGVVREVGTAKQVAVVGWGDGGQQHQARKGAGSFCEVRGSDCRRLLLEEAGEKQKSMQRAMDILGGFIEHRRCLG
jgi:hypothetical protein